MPSTSIHDDDINIRSDRIQLINPLLMQLPEITQDEPAAIQELVELVKERYAGGSEGRFNFQLGEINTLRMMPASEGVVSELQKLLAHFLSMRIENGYCYYKVKSLLSSQKEQLVSLITLQCNLLSEKKSGLHKINHLIVMRQVLLGKFQTILDLNKQAWEYIEDIRFINEEIIKLVRQWKTQMQSRGCDKEIVVYLYKNENYLTKMITDNHQILLKFNAKQDVFWKAPNPFFVTAGQTDEKLSVKSINFYLQILSQEKAQQLKMMIESPFAKAGKSSALQNELVLLRNKIEDQKIVQIKTIYYVKQQDLRASRQQGFNLNQQRIDLMTMKNGESIKNLQKLIKIKEIEVLKDLNKKKINPFQIKGQDKNPKGKQRKAEQFLSKIQSLKVEVQKNVKLNAQKQKNKGRLPKAQSQLKASRPKIKIITQRQSSVAVEPIVKSIFDVINNESRQKLNRSRSTFYKQMNIQDSKEKSQIQNEPNKKQEHINMIVSAYSSTSSLVRSKRNQSTLVRFNIKRSASSIKVDADKSRSREEELKEVKESLLVLNHRIRQQSIKNIYSNKSKAIFQGNTSRLKTVQKVSPQQKKTDNIQTIETRNNNIVTNYEDSIKKKQGHITELKKRLLQLRSKNNEEASKVLETPSQSSIIKETMQKQRQSLQLEQLKIRQEMKKEQLKFLALKQKQYLLREAQMQQKYAMQLQKVKQEIEAKNKQFELKIIEQQRKQRQNQQKMQDIRKKSELMAFELQQKQLKEQLMQEILKEQQLKRQRELFQKGQNDKTEELMEAIRQEQAKYKLELQRKTVQTFEEQKMKINELYFSLKRKNQALQADNIKRHKELKRLQEEKKKQIGSMQQLQQQLLQKQKTIAFQRYISNQSPIKVHKTAEQIHLQILNDQEQLQQIKETIKAELVQEIKRKRKQEDEEDRQYEEERRKKIAQMEEEMRRVMRLQEEGLERIEQQYRLKNEQIVRDHEQQLRIQQMAKQKMAQETQQALKKLEHSQPFQVETLIAIETGLEGQGNRLKRTVSNLSADQLSRENSEFFIQQKKPNEEPKRQQPPPLKEANQIPKYESHIEIRQQPSVVEQKTQPKNDLQATVMLTEPRIESELSLPSQQNMESPSKHPKIENISNIAQQSPSPVKPTQAVKQNSQQIKQKYDLLMEMVSKPIKQIFMSYDQIDSYLNKFYSQLAHEVKEMIPYSRKEIQAIFREKKVDVFDGYNFGLFRPRERKFMLFGNIQCIPMIASKYGQIQVEQVFLFNKSNGYQKQFLSKQIKIYQKIGYIYQKKTEDEGIYTIKFIVKIPKDTKKDVHLRDQLEIKTIIHLQEHEVRDTTLVKSNCVFYTLGQALNQSLNEQEKSELAAKSDVQSKYAARRMRDLPFSNTAVKTEIVSHNVTEVSINLPIKYIQTADQPFFTLQTVQYVIKATEQRLYVATFQEHNLAIVIYKMNEADVPQGFTLETFLQSKFKQMEKVSDLFVFLPVWENSKKYQYKGSTRSFSYLQKTHANLVYGSIVKNKVHKGDFIFLQAPFAFVLFEISSAQVLKRILFGHVVSPEEVLRMKRVIT